MVTLSRQLKILISVKSKPDKGIMIVAKNLSHTVEESLGASESAFVFVSSTLKGAVDFKFRIAKYGK